MAQPTEVYDDRYSVPALRRGLAILELFSHERRVITVPDITRELSVSRATAFRLARTLEIAGYLERRPNTKAFRLGRQSLAISFEYLYALDVVDVARPFLESLRDKFDVTTNLAIRHGTAMLYVLRAPAQSSRTSSLVVPVGTRFPVHAVSSGRALLLDLPESELDGLFEGFDFAAYPGHAPQSLASLKAALAKERRKGYVICPSMFIKGKRSVAVPVRDNTGKAIAAVNVSDPSAAVQELDGVVKDELISIAEQISARLGYRPTTGSAFRLRDKDQAMGAKGEARTSRESLERQSR